MEDSSEKTATQETPTVASPSKEKSQGSGEPYPAEPLPKSLETVKEVIAQNGTAQPITKEAIAISLGKKQSTLTLSFSTWTQYGILVNQHGKGYLPSSTYQKYTDYAFPEDERRALLTMFKNPPLYKKIIDNLNNQVLPPEDKFPNLLKGDQYKINPNSAERAAKIFFENARYLKVIDNNNRLRFLLPESGSMSQQQQEKPDEDEVKKNKRENSNDDADDDLFELPIPLGKRRIAYLSYPLQDLTMKDIKVIRKALDFIASSIPPDNSNKEDSGSNISSDKT